MNRDTTTSNVSEAVIKRLLGSSKPEPDKGELEFRVDGSIWKNGKVLAEEPDEWQNEWVERRVRGPARSWKRWFE
jgi:hypothetical protein